MRKRGTALALALALLGALALPAAVNSGHIVHHLDWSSVDAYKSIQVHRPPHPKRAVSFDGGGTAPAAADGGHIVQNLLRLCGPGRRALDVGPG